MSLTQKGTSTKTRFKLNFPTLEALRATWSSELKAGRFFIPTPERLEPFAKVVLAFGVAEAPFSLEIDAEVVFVLEAAHCPPGRMPGLGFSVRMGEREIKGGEASLEGRWQDAREALGVVEGGAALAQAARGVGSTPAQAARGVGSTPAQAARGVGSTPTQPSGGGGSAPLAVAGGGRAAAASGEVVVVVRASVDMDGALEPDAALSRRILKEAGAFEARTRGGGHYEVLGVARNADKRAIRSSYSALMRQFHPDNYFRRLEREAFGALEGVYQRITVAYEVLITPKRRIAYDAEIGNLSGSEAGGSADQKIALRRRQKYSDVNPKMVKMADSLYAEAVKERQRGDGAGAAARIKLALRYNPHHEEARRMLKELSSKEG